MFYVGSDVAFIQPILCNKPHVTLVMAIASIHEPITVNNASKGWPLVVFSASDHIWFAFYFIYIYMYSVRCDMVLRPSTMMHPKLRT